MPATRTTALVLRLLAIGALVALGQWLLALAGLADPWPLWTVFYTF